MLQFDVRERDTALGESGPRTEGVGLIASTAAVFDSDFHGDPVLWLARRRRRAAAQLCQGRIDRPMFLAAGRPAAHVDVKPTQLSRGAGVVDSRSTGSRAPQP